jgi:hypothetical protein
MKKFICALTFIIGFSVNAGTITIELSDSNVNVGDSVQVSLLATGFDPFDTFDFDFDFDISLFSYDDTTSLTSDLLAVPPFAFDVNQVPDGMALSFLDFNLYAGGDFLLASFDLLALAPGDSLFSLSDLLFSDSSTSTIDVNSDSVAQSSVTTVSEPGSLALFGLAGLALFGFRRKA